MNEEEKITEVEESTGKDSGKNIKFSKKIVTMIILLAVSFTSAVLYIFLKVGSEPSTLIIAVFGFLTVELWSLANIKNTETKKKREEYDEKNMMNTSIGGFGNSYKSNYSDNYDEQDGSEWM